MNDGCCIKDVYNICYVYNCNDDTLNICIFCNVKINWNNYLWKLSCTRKVEFYKTVVPKKFSKHKNVVCQEK